MFLKKVLSTFFRSDKFKILYSCVQAFEFIRSKKGCKNPFQKHDLLQKSWTIACDLGFAGTNFSWNVDPRRFWVPVRVLGHAICSFLLREIVLAYSQALKTSKIHSFRCFKVKQIKIFQKCQKSILLHAILCKQMRWFQLY